MSKIRVGIKMRVTPEQSQKVQEICFENGIEWIKGKTLRHLDKPFLFIEEYVSFMDKDQEGYFNKQKNEEVSAELFIRTNGTCIESETPTEDNNKGEQMEELKLECLVEGYEGTYFEVGQVWETRDGINKAKVIKILTKEDYPILCEYYSKAEDKNFEFNVNDYGKYTMFSKNRLDLVRLISTEAPTNSTPTEEPQPKTLSEYLKENNAYESFVENCVEAFLKNLAWYKVFKSENKTIILENTFNWRKSKQGKYYWNRIFVSKPKNLIYDMNEIVFAEVDKNPTKRYMVFVEGKNNPKVIHDCIASARREASRLSAKEVGLKVSVVEIVCEFKSKVIVEEV